MQYHADDHLLVAREQGHQYPIAQCGRRLDAVVLAEWANRQLREGDLAPFEIENTLRMEAADDYR
jgi:hypothetical protein